MLDHIPPFSTDGDSFNSTKPATLSRFVGKHFIYTYENGWHYETYISSAYTADFRIHSGLLAGRWVTDTKVHLVKITDDICKMSWSEPTGTNVSLIFDIAARRMHGTIFFPAWIKQHPAEAIVYENAHDAEIQAFRNAGPTYPVSVVDEFADISFMEDRGENDKTVIACSSKDLPRGWADRKN
jgi:phenolic acid decarboxylase